MHPDPYYAPNTAESTACHRKKKKKKKKKNKKKEKNISGYYGTPYSFVFISCILNWSC